jgi:hypothetical protein
MIEYYERKYAETGDENYLKLLRMFQGKLVKPEPVMEVVVTEEDECLSCKL